MAKTCGPRVAANDQDRWFYWGGEGEDASRHLCEIERLVEKANEKERQCPIPPPTFKMVLTATQYGYRRDDGVLIVPIGCLRD